jgi:hypothetical protein
MDCFASSLDRPSVAYNDEVTGSSPVTPTRHPCRSTYRLTVLTGPRSLPGPAGAADRYRPPPLAVQKASRRSRAGTKAADEGADWLRVDVWTTNEHLQHYYLGQGFTYVRTVVLPHNPSGALFHGQPLRVPTPRLQEASTRV